MVSPFKYKGKQICSNSAVKQAEMAARICPLKISHFIPGNLLIMSRVGGGSLNHLLAGGILYLSSSKAYLCSYIFCLFLLAVNCVKNRIMKDKLARSLESFI